MTEIECAFCGWEFTPRAEGITACVLCYREGRVHAAQYPVLLRQLRLALEGLGSRIDFTATGQNEFALEVRGLGLFPVIVGTVAVKTDDGWATYPDVPMPGTPWAVALFGNKNQWPQYPEITKLPATDAELVAFVTEHRLRLDVFAPGQGCAMCGLPRPCGCVIEQEA